MKRNKVKDYIYLFLFGLAALFIGTYMICKPKEELLDIIMSWIFGIFLLLFGLFVIFLVVYESIKFKQEPVKNEIISTRKRILGSLYGFFVGDALGVPVEFLSRDKLKSDPVTDMIGNGTHNQPKGTWSDDSSMVLATIDSLYENKDKNIKNGIIDYNDLMDKFLKWKEKGEYTPFGKMFDIGYTTEAALLKYKKDNNDPFCGTNDIKSNGNGSLMRMLPIVLYSERYYGASNHVFVRQTADYQIIREASSLTHSHILSIVACHIYNMYLSYCFSYYLDAKSAYSALSNYFKDFFEKKRVGNEEDTELCKQYFHRLIYEDISKVNLSEIKSSGFVVDTLESSIYCILTTNNYKDAVLKAVNLGEDTDTIAAITGSIAGALYGIDNIPEEWINSLQRKELIDEYVNKFLEIDDMKTNLMEEFKVKATNMDRVKRRKEKMTKDSWDIKELGKDAITIDTNIVLSKEDKEKLDYGHAPAGMDDHWFMYVDLDEKTINYHRSWTGIQIFKGFYKEEDNKIVIYKVLVNSNLKQYDKKSKEKEIENFRHFIENDIKNNIEENKQ